MRTEGRREESVHQGSRAQNIREERFFSFRKKGIGPNLYILGYIHFLAIFDLDMSN